MPIRVLVADDHGVIRQGLRTDLGSDPGFEFVGEASDGAKESSRNKCNISTRDLKLARFA